MLQLCSHKSVLQCAYIHSYKQSITSTEVNSMLYLMYTFVYRKLHIYIGAWNDFVCMLDD